jgi:coproporphyrinogen III oxidase
MRSSLLALAYLLTTTAGAGDFGDDLSALTEEQARVARQMLQFMAKTEARFWQRVDALNGGAGITESHVWEPPENGHYEVRVHRGPVAEKAGVMTVMTQVEQPPFVTGGRWNRFIEVAVHPKTPLVGMLHATFSVQISSAGKGNIGATMDMMQAAQPAEDLALMRSRVDAVLIRHGASPERYHSKSCGKPDEGFWKWHRLGTCTGVSMYGPQLLADDATFGLVTDLYGTVIDTYFEILAKRQDQSYGEAELAIQGQSRRRWLEDQLFWDMLAKTFVPYEAWSAVNAPPVVYF